MAVRIQCNSSRFVSGKLLRTFSSNQYIGNLCMFSYFSLISSVLKEYIFMRML